MRPASTLPYRGLHLVTASPGRPNAAQRPENAERLRLFHGTSKEIVLVLALGVAAVLMAVQF